MENKVTISPNGILTVEQGANGKYKVTGKQNGKDVELVLNVDVPADALILEYTITTPGATNLFYEKVSPAGDEHNISVFPEGTTAKLVKINGGEATVIDPELNLYHQTTSKADTCFTYNFTDTGVYELRIAEWKGNTNDPGTHNPDDAGMGVYSQMLRGSKIPTLSGVKAFALPGNVASFYSMFNSCTATGHMPSVISDTATRPTDMFDSAKFETIGNIVMPNSWKAQTSVTSAGSDQSISACQMFIACSNLKSIGNIVLGNCINTKKMFDGDTKLESIGVLDCLKDATDVTDMFKNCEKLASVKFKSLPTAAVTLDLSVCPLNAASLDYMAENVNNGAATIKFSNTTKELANYATTKTVLNTKGYTIDPE